MGKNYLFRKKPHHIGLVPPHSLFPFLPLKKSQTTYTNVPFIIQLEFYSEPVSGCVSFCPFSWISLFHSVFRCVITHLYFLPCHYPCFLWKENPLKFSNFKLCDPLTERAATLLMFLAILLKLKLFVDAYLSNQFRSKVKPS